MNYPTHSVSGPLSVMNCRPVKVSAYGYRNRNHDDFFKNMEFSNVIALFQMENGAAVRIAEAREMQGNIGCDHEDFRIFGTRGSYSCLCWRDNGRIMPDGEVKPYQEVQYTENELRVEKLPQEVADAFNRILNKNAKPGDDFIPSGHGGSHPYLVHEFVSSVAENRTPAITARHAATYMAMGAAAHKSAMKDGEIVEVTDFGYASKASC